MARWTDLAVWRGPTRNEGDGDGVPLEAEDHLIEVRGLVLHIADGYYDGTIAWQHNTSANVSSHFVVAGPRDVAKGVPDGKLAQVVDTADRAWTQRDGNSRWLSLECSGFTGDQLSAAQIEAAAQLLARAHREYGVPLQVATSPSGRGLGHHSMGAESGVDWGHDQCPGPKIIAQKPAIVARAIEIANGDDDMNLTDQIKFVKAADVKYSADQTTVGGILASTNYYVLQSRNQNSAAFAALSSKLDSQAVVLQTLADALKAGGSDIDTAAILKRIDDRAADDAARDAEHAQLVDELQDQIHQLQTALAAAGQAQASALGATPSGS